MQKLRIFGFALVASGFASLAMLMLTFIEAKEVFWSCLIIMVAMLLFHFLTTKIATESNSKDLSENH